MEASQEENGEKKEEEEKPAVCCCFNCGARCGVYDGDLCVRCKELRACRFCSRHLPEVCFGCDASQDVCEVRFFLFFVSSVICAYFHVKKSHLIRHQKIYLFNFLNKFLSTESISVEFRTAFRLQPLTSNKEYLQNANARFLLPLQNKQLNNY